MRKLGARFVIGLIVLAIGVSIAIELGAGVKLPIGRIVIATLLVVLGARMLAHAWLRRDAAEIGADAVLATKNFSQRGALDRDAHFDVVLGRSVVDLTGLDEPDHDVTVTVEALFGSAVVKLPAALAYDVEATSAFGAVRMPDRTATAMGSIVYRTQSDHPPRLHLRVSAVFGACQLVEAATLAG